MKKVIVFLLALVLILSFSITAFAAEKTEVSLNNYSSNGNKIVVDVDLSKDGDPCMLQFCIAYDSTVLDCVSVVSGGALAGSTAPTINKTEGKIYFVWDALDPIKDGGTVLRIEFMPKADNKTTSVWIDTNEEFIVANENFEEIGSIKGDLELVTGNVSGNISSENESSKEETAESEGTTGNEGTSSGNEPPKENIPEEGYSNGIKIDKTSLSVKIGEEAVIEVSETDKEIFWFSSDESVAKVENGKITAIGQGTATITVSTEDGLEEAACIVTVTGENLSEDNESGNNVLNVDSPRNEKEESTPFWVWIIIGVLGIAAAFAVFAVVSNLKKSSEAEK